MATNRKHPVVVRREGATASERYLGHLCNRTFLSLWSYAGLFRDQGNAHGGDGKELCDLMVVFGDHIVLFSDKDCAFPGGKNIEVRWQRWFRKSILKSAEQIWGAERWVTSYPHRLFLDKACTQPFPLELPPLDRVTIHRIAVAHGVSEHCREHFGGGSGSLFFNSDIDGAMHWDANRGPCRPFEVGWIDKNRGFVHVIDDVSLGIVLESRNTIRDFIDYLAAKEELVSRKGLRLFIAGEENLLASYMMTFDNDGHGFDVPSDVDTAVFPAGEWDKFLNSEQYKYQAQADQRSFAWDSLIEMFNRHILGGTSHYASHESIADREKIMRFLARESRVRRRLLANALLGLLAKSVPSRRSCRLVAPSVPGDPYYVFLLFPERVDRSEEEYRDVRLKMLEAYCLVARLMHQDATDIIGIATNSDKNRPSRSEDALYLDGRYWTPAMESEARDLQRRLRILVNLKSFGGKISEFPIPLKKGEIHRRPGKNPRNKACPCGSGRKFKRCCGRQLRG